MHLTGLDLFLWAATFVGHVSLLFVLWFRNRIRSFPIFTALIGMNIVRTTVLFIIQSYGTKAQYFYTFWSFAILDVGLQLGVVCEIASHVFQTAREWTDSIRRQLIWWAIGSIAIATGLTWAAAPETRMWKQTVLIKGSFISAALMSELFVGMIALSVQARFPWSTYTARISEGLGAYSMATLALEMVRTYFGLKSDSHVYASLSHLRITLYLICLSYWIITLWRDVAVSSEMPDLMRKQLRELRDSSAQHIRLLESWRRR